MSLVLRYLQKPMTCEEFARANADSPPPESTESSSADPDAGPRKRPTSPSSEDARRHSITPSKRPRASSGTRSVATSRARVDDPAERPAFPPEDFFGIPLASKEDIREWNAMFPCVSKRNFYVIQNHHATRDHFDLRVQLDGETTSWAIPRGLSKFEKGTRRLAIETQPHKINYTLYEGGGIGTTAVWDLGNYTIHPTKAEELKRAADAKEKADADSSDDEDTENDVKAIPEDWRQEDLFCEGLFRGSFKGVPARWGRPPRSPVRDSGHKRGFIIELNGARFEGLRLLFIRDSTDAKFSLPKYLPKTYDGPALHTAHWLVSLDSRPGSAGIEHPLGDKSILTSRTMAEIKEARPAEIIVAQEKAWGGWVDEVIKMERAEEAGMDDKQWEEDWESGDEDGRGGE